MESVCLHWPRASPLSQSVLHPKPFCPACVPLEGGQGVPFFPFTPLLPPTFARLSPTTTTPAFTNSFTLLLLRCKGGICHRKKCNLPQIPPLCTTSNTYRYQHTGPSSAAEKTLLSTTRMHFPGRVPPLFHEHQYI